MCVAVPGKVVSINGKKAQVDFGGNLVEAGCGLADIQIGDHVLVHAGYIIQTLSKSEAEEMEELMKLIYE